MHKKKILSIVLTTLLISGCDNGGDNSASKKDKSNGNVVTDPIVNPVVDPGTDNKIDPIIDPPEVDPVTPVVTPPIVDPVIPVVKPTLDIKNGYLRIGNSIAITSTKLTCNGQGSQGFPFVSGDTVSCQLDGITLATFSPSTPAIAPGVAYSSTVENVVFELANADEFHSASADKLLNANLLLSKFNACPADKTQICLPTHPIELNRFKAAYQNDLDKNSADFKKLVEETTANNTALDKAPSTHIAAIVPAVDPYFESDFNARRVAANAESIYQYQPTKIILTQGRLVDSKGSGIAGIDYYTPSGRGVTDQNGNFDFSWGEVVSFGIDSFELGDIRANKSTITLHELGDATRGFNIEQLIHRYAETGPNGNSKLKESVREEFAQYPNVINSIINLSLAKGSYLDVGNGKNVEIEDQFIKQFKEGQARSIDNKICGSSCPAPLTPPSPNAYGASADSSIQADINKLWGINPQYKSVSKFHVFHDAISFYNSNGNARGQAVVNISNNAFPVLMARNDTNHWLAFGEKRAWDKDGLAYITESPSMMPLENVTAETSTFDLPFISIGDVGQGKLMVMGNSFYSSILRCPNGYSWEGAIDKDGQCTKYSDSDDMKNFMVNTLRYLTKEVYSPETSTNITVGTNIGDVYFKRHGKGGYAMQAVPFALHKDFGKINVQNMSGYRGIDPKKIPLLILHGFEYMLEKNLGDYDPALIADAKKPKLTSQNVTDLIQYMNQGGSILMMETIVNDLKGESASDYIRLLDSAGLSTATLKNVVINGNSGIGARDQYSGTIRSVRDEGIWIYERYPVDEKTNALPFQIKEGKVVWTFQDEKEPGTKPKLEVATWKTVDSDGQEIEHFAYIDTKEPPCKETDSDRPYCVGSESERVGKTNIKSDAQIALEKQVIFDAFPGLEECKRDDYHYEINCLEYRPGNGIQIPNEYGGLQYPRYTELQLGKDVAQAMVKAADVGTNIRRLYEHELYFRTWGDEGTRLNSTELERLYQNMTVWMWNNEQYRYAADVADELGFKTFTEFLNCYAPGKYSGTSCPDELKASLIKHGMIFDTPERAGMMNPSYPLNYMEKPLTRLMLGRSFWDLNIKVDTQQYPGEATGGSTETANNISLYSNATKWFANNMQSTGLWAPAHQEVTVSSTADTEVTVTVALADDLTGRPKHELALNRPPRVSKSFTLPAKGSHTFTSPYGGLIYIQGNSSTEATGDFTFDGVIKAPFFKNNTWVNSIESPAPLAEIESASFVYTTPKKNLEASNYEGDLTRFGQELDLFASAMNDFYARDGKLTVDGVHNPFTTKELAGHKQRFVNDVQISIGNAHSGYPIMNDGFVANSSELPATPLNDWLLWHEAGHNAVEAPMMVPGGGEVVNNLVALYMQDRYNGKMSRVESDIQGAPEYLSMSEGQAWAKGGANDRLVMYAQLKEWAEHNVDISHWYAGKELPAFYSEREGMKGWNMFQLMHRKARGDTLGDERFGTNYCAQKQGSAADRLMLCMSYITQKDLSDFFKLWNPGATTSQIPGSDELRFTGGVSTYGYETLRSMKLLKPINGPEKVNRISMFDMTKN